MKHGLRGVGVFDCKVLWLTSQTRRLWMRRMWFGLRTLFFQLQEKGPFDLEGSEVFNIQKYRCWTFGCSNRAEWRSIFDKVAESCWSKFVKLASVFFSEYPSCADMRMFEHVWFLVVDGKEHKIRGKEIKLLLAEDSKLWRSKISKWVPHLNALTNILIQCSQSFETSPGRGGQRNADSNRF